MAETDTYNIKVKDFGGGNVQVTMYSKTIMTGRISPLKGRKRKAAELTSLSDTKYRVYKSAKDSARRSKGRIYDYARANHWDWFVTLTFDPTKVDSMDYDVCTKKLSKWLNNTRSKCGPDFAYLVVPEQHKSGRWHYHGLFAGCDNLDFVDSGHRTDDGDVIYNIGGYRLGFTTATRIKDMYRVTMYIGKYITKSLCVMTRNHRRYWQSRNCKLPDERVADLAMDEQQELYNGLVDNPCCVNVTCKEYEHDDKQGYIYYIELREDVADNADNVEDRDATLSASGGAGDVGGDKA